MATDALAALQAGQPRSGLDTALQAWRAARAWQRQLG
jgi:phytoene synthase